MAFTFTIGETYQVKNGKILTGSYINSDASGQIINVGRQVEISAVVLQTTVDQSVPGRVIETLPKSGIDGTVDLALDAGDTQGIFTVYVR